MPKRSSAAEGCLQYVLEEVGIELVDAGCDSALRATLLRPLHRCKIDVRCYHWGN